MSTTGTIGKSSFVRISEFLELGADRLMSTTRTTLGPFKIPRLIEPYGFI